MLCIRSLLVASLLLFVTGCCHRPCKPPCGPDAAWPDVTCSNDMTARAMLDQIIVLAQNADQPTVVQRAQACKADDLFSQGGAGCTSHCGCVMSAFAAAKRGDWAICSTRLGHGHGGLEDTARIAPGAILGWPDVDCGDGRTARQLLEEIIAWATAAAEPGVVALAKRCRGNDGIEDNAVPPTCGAPGLPCCPCIREAWNFAQSGNWPQCSTRLGHGHGGG